MPARAPVGYALAALALATLAAGAAREVARAGEPGTAIDAEFAGLRAALPAERRLGFACDLPLDDHPGAARLARAQYALAPKVLVPGAVDAGHVVASFADPEALPGWCAAERFRVVARFEDGLALLERDPP